MGAPSRAVRSASNSAGKASDCRHFFAYWLAVIQHHVNRGLKDPTSKQPGTDKSGSNRGMLCVQTDEEGTMHVCWRLGARQRRTDTC